MSMTNFKPRTPCQAGKAKAGMQVCTTALGDEICKACKRSKYMVDHWNEFSVEKQIKIMDELKSVD